MPLDFSCHESKHNPSHPGINIILSNGRFLVTLDLATQGGPPCLYRRPYGVSRLQVLQGCEEELAKPAPSIDPEGYITVTKKAIQVGKIDMIIPMHEEILYLAECLDDEVTKHLFAPNFLEPYQLHNK